MKKRILSFLLTLLMVVSVFPAPAYATDSTDVTETPTVDCSGDVGKYVKLNEAVNSFLVCYKETVDGTYFSNAHEDFTDGTIFEITDWYADDSALWYRVKFYSGSVVESSFTEGFPEEPWFQQTSANELVFLDTCATCGRPDCSGHTEPENPCACCDSCTGAEGCACECGACDFCEKVEEPTVPSISDTVNGQTVTVSGDTIPEGAELGVQSVVDVDGGFAYDINIINGGEKWQPAEGETVTVDLSVADVEDGHYIEVIHFLENEQAIIKAIAAGNVLTADWLSEIFPAAVEAYQKATGEIGSVAYEVLEQQVNEGKITFNTASFSIYTWNGSSYSKTSTGDSDRIVFHETLTSDGANGSTYFVTAGHAINCDRGGIAVVNRQWRYSSGAPLSANNDLTGANGAQIKFTVAAGTALGTSFDIECRIWQGLGWTGWNRVNFVVVEEWPVHFTDNIFGKSVSSLTAITDGGSRKQGVTLPTLSQTGYRFLGWKVNNTGTTYAGGTAFMPTASGQRLYAQWSPISYTVKFDPNTANAGGGAVSGSMSNIGMTYDVETTLPRSKYVNNGDGYVFLGWATSPTGDVVYKDGATVKNLTTTNGATVTLYAKWKYGLASTVYIGINNTYHNPKGTYTAGGVTINSYHTYPNEPAQMTGDFDRVVDTTGSWTFDKESASPLKNTAASYVNGNIFNSPDYEMTYVQGENTLGIADPTGTAVRAMLKFTEADYNAMIAVWLEGMRTTLVGYGDTTFDWQNAKAEDFTMVPYVIKFQNYDSWYIDMVVVPKALYTLAYDGNIENGYTATFTGVAFPPSAQYTDGSAVPVVTTPIGYQNNNMQVTKVVDGHTYTAAFQYWYDANGNTYYGGSTGRNTITLTEDTILYAKWDYPDASFGNLNITKAVVDKDDYGDPPATQNFTFQFITNASGSYNYAVYDPSANVKASGSISNNGTFTLQNGWRIRITDLPKDATYSVTETAVSYYTSSGSVSGTISAGATTYATVTNTYQKHAAYTVKHYLQNADKVSYTEQTADQRSLYGVVGQSTSAQPETYSGYSVKAFSQTTIKADGSTVISIYYDLISTATITWKNWDGTILETDENVLYGATPSYDGETPQKAATAQYTYTFDGWDKEVVSVIGDVTYTAKFKETVIVYNITYHLNGGTLANGKTNPETYTVETDSFTLNNPTKTGYKFNGWATFESATTGTETVTIEKGTTGDKTYYAVWERSLVDLTITTTSANQEQSFIFTVSGTPSDSSFGTIMLDVVLVGTDSITIKDLPVGTYTVIEKNGWSWRENNVESKTADLRVSSQTVSFDFGNVDDLHWLSGYSYKCKKGGS